MNEETEALGDGGFAQRPTTQTSKPETGNTFSSPPLTIKF